MLDTTIDAVRALLRTDPSITPRDRTLLLSRLRYGPEPPATPIAPPAPELPKVCSRATAAKAMDRSLRFVDSLAKQGLLPKVTLPGRKRAIGFRQEDIQRLIASGVNAAA